MSNLNDIFFTPAANQELTYDQVLEDVQRYFAENHASTIAEAGEGNAERATSLLKELMEHYIVKRKYALDGLSTKELCSKLYEDMAGYSFLKKWIYKPGVEEVNINAYNEENCIYTTLVSGSIALRPLNDTHAELVLTPGHQAVFLKSDRSTRVRPVDTRAVTSWHDGRFSFEELTLQQIMTTLSRWYNFDFRFADERLVSTVFKGSAPRYAELAEVLSILEKSGGITFRVEGKTIVVEHAEDSL